MSDEDPLDPLITQCPNCDTRFRVSENQLQMASGRVRCGACLTVFDGAEHLLLDAEPLDEGETDDVDAVLAELEDLDSSPRMFEPPSDPEDENYLDDQVSRGLAELEAQLMADLRQEGGAPQPVVYAEPESPVTPASVQSELVESVEPVDISHSEPASEPVAASGSEAAVESVAEPVSGPDTVELAQESEGPPPAPPLILPQLDEPVLDAGTLEEAPQKSRRSGLSWIVVLLLLIGLPAQVLWFQYEAWVQDPSIRPVYQTICGVLDCELPPLRDVSLIVSQKSFIRAHPEQAGARIVDVLMVNNAAFPQPYPLIELRATSVRGQLIAGRRFKPEEYLQGGVKPTDLMPPSTPVHVSLEIQDPGGQAMNFEVKFR